MSSARRLQEDYRRIIGLQDETRGLDDDLPRMRIGGQRGVWQIGNNALKTGSAGGEDEDGNAVDPVTPDEGGDNQNDDGSGEGGSGTDPDSPLEPEIIDPENPESGADVTDSTFGGGWATGGAKSFVDCETGQCIELVEVGGFVPPEGWDDPDQGPPNNDPTLAPDGSVWHSSSLGVVAYNYDCGPHTTDVRSETFVQCRRVDQNNFVEYSWRLAPCSNHFDFCENNERPSEFEEFWPADNCIQLAPNSDGNWAASNRENPNDMTSKYSEAKSILNVCNSSGEPIDIYQRVGGGYVYFNQTQGIWAGSDSNGRIRSFGSTSTLDQEIARPKN